MAASGCQKLVLSSGGSMYFSIMRPMTERESSPHSLLIRRSHSSAFTALLPSGGSPGASAYIKRLSRLACVSVSETASAIAARTYAGMGSLSIS
ncbi:hypothetical protein D3C71_969530 [compost metagenome]